MYFQNIIGQEEIKYYLRKIYKIKRIPQSLLFLGNEGYGTLPMAIAFAKKILYNEKINDTLEMYQNLYFFFPIPNKNNILNKNTAFIYKWYEFLKCNPYSDVFDWFRYIGIENKIGQIGVDQVKDLIKISFQKSYNKVIILWMPEYLNGLASSKLSNILEEPPINTLFIFVGKNEEKIKSNLISRMQIIRFKRNNDELLQNILYNKFNIDKFLAKKLALQAEGDFNYAINFMYNNNKYEFEKCFIIWMRNAFLLKKNYKYLINILKCSELVSSWNKKTQNEFLNYCLSNFRQALISNYKLKNLSFNPLNSNEFKWEVFSYYITIKNIKNIAKMIDQAINHIDKNLNTKLIFLDLFINIIKYIFNN